MHRQIKLEDFDWKTDSVTNATVYQKAYGRNDFKMYYNIEENSYDSIYLKEDITSLYFGSLSSYKYIAVGEGEDDVRGLYFNGGTSIDYFYYSKATKTITTTKYFEVPKDTQY